MAGPQKKRKSGSSGGTLLGIVLLLVALTVAGGLSFAYYRAANRPDIDAATLCPEDGPSGHLAILLDTTDPLTLSQLQAARQIIERRIDQAEDFTRVSFSTVSPDSDVRQSAFFSLCKPPTGKNASQLTDNPRMIKEKFRDDFERPLRTALDELMGIGEASSSPIMEALQEFVTSIPDFNVTDIPREVVMMTDLMQHSDAFSFYRGGTWSSFSDAGGPRRFGQNFEGVKLQVLRIPRRVEMAATVDDFWVRYFDAQGFNRIEVDRIGDL